MLGIHVWTFHEDVGFVSLSESGLSNVSMTARHLIAYSLIIGMAGCHQLGMMCSCLLACTVDNAARGQVGRPAATAEGVALTAADIQGQYTHARAAAGRHQAAPCCT